MLEAPIGHFTELEYQIGAEVVTQEIGYFRKTPDCTATQISYRLLDQAGQEPVSAMGVLLTEDIPPRLTVETAEASEAGIHTLQLSARISESVNATYTF